MTSKAPSEVVPSVLVVYATEFFVDYTSWVFPDADDYAEKEFSLPPCLADETEVDVRLGGGP